MKKSKPKNDLDLRAIRDQLGMTREELAVKLGVAMKTVARWERGQFKASRLARRQIDLLLAERKQA